jgi:hypothetical protein
MTWPAESCPMSLIWSSDHRIHSFTDRGRRLFVLGAVIIILRPGAQFDSGFRDSKRVNSNRVRRQTAMLNCADGFHLACKTLINDTRASPSQYMHAVDVESND